MQPCRLVYLLNWVFSFRPSHIYNSSTHNCSTIFNRELSHKAHIHTHAYIYMQEHCDEAERNRGKDTIRVEGT